MFRIHFDAARTSARRDCRPVVAMVGGFDRSDRARGARVARVGPCCIAWALAHRFHRELNGEPRPKRWAYASVQTFPAGSSSAVSITSLRHPKPHMASAPWRM